jgi:hypothetical protein
MTNLRLIGRCGHDRDLCECSCIREHVSTIKAKNRLAIREVVSRLRIIGYAAKETIVDGYYTVGWE